MKTPQTKLEHKKDMGLHRLRLYFWNGYDLAQCYEAIFRTIPQHRLNGCTFCHLELNGEEEGYQINIFSQDESALHIIQQMLAAAPGFMQTQVEDVIRKDVAPQYGILDGWVKRDQLRSHMSGEQEPITAGMRSSREMAPLKSEWHPEHEVCGTCGSHTEGRAFCPVCKARLASLSRFAKGYLAFIVVINLLQLGRFFLENYMWLSYASVLTAAAFYLFEIVVLLVAVALLLQYRKLGFYLLAGGRIFTLLETAFTYGFEGAAMDFIPTLVFLGVAYAALRKDLVKMPCF